MHYAKRLCSIILMFALLMTSMGWAGATGLAGKVREDANIYSAPEDDDQLVIEELKKDVVLEELREDAVGWYVFTYKGPNGDVDAYIPVEDVVLTDVGSGLDDGASDDDPLPDDDTHDPGDADDILDSSISGDPADDTDDAGDIDVPDAVETPDSTDPVADIENPVGLVDVDQTELDDANGNPDANQDLVGNQSVDDPAQADDGAAADNAEDANTGDDVEDATAGDDAEDANTGDDTEDATAGDDAEDANTGDDTEDATAGDDADDANTGDDVTAETVPESITIGTLQAADAGNAVDSTDTTTQDANTVVVPETLQAITTLAVGLPTEGLPSIFDENYARVSPTSSGQRVVLYASMRPGSTQLNDYGDGYVVRILRRYGDWVQVNARDGNEGFMRTSSLRFWVNGDWGGGTQPPVPGEIYAYVNMNSTTARLNLREGPGSSYRLIDSYYSGKRVQILEWDAYWSKVLVDSNEGYMQTAYLSLTWPPNNPSPSPGDDTMYATVNNANPRDWLNLRAYPSTSASVLGHYYNGKTVLVLDYNPTWCYVQVDGLVGYMMTKFLHFGSTPGPSPSPSEYATVNNPNPRDKLNLRALPSTGSTSLGLYSNGTVVRILSYNATWCHVEVAGRTGYMMTYYLSLGSTPGPSPNPTPVGYATVNNPNPRDRLNLRTGPSTGTRSLGLYYNGTRVSVLEYGATWCHVQVNGITGYMMTYYLSFSSYPGSTPTPTIGVVNNPISTQRLDLRSFPSPTARSLGRYANGTIVSILTYDSTWCRVSVGGITGYMLTQYLTLR